jgi:hypothetical protein
LTIHPRDACTAATFQIENFSSSLLIVSKPGNQLVTGIKLAHSIFSGLIFTLIGSKERNHSRNMNWL